MTWQSLKTERNESFTKTKSGWTAGHVAQHQHYLNIFEVLRRVTTSIESWEEIESYDEQIERPMDIYVDKNQQRKEKYESQRISGVPRLELEKPDVMGEHPVTDTEDDQDEAEYTTIPPSPMFSRTTSQQAIEEERMERVEADRANQKPVMRKQKSHDAYNHGEARYSDKHSVVSVMPSTMKTISAPKCSNSSVSKSPKKLRFSTPFNELAEFTDDKRIKVAIKSFICPNPPFLLWWAAHRVHSPALNMLLLSYKKHLLATNSTKSVPRHGEDSIDEGVTYPGGNSQHLRTKSSNEVFINGDGFKASGQLLKRADHGSKEFEGSRSQNLGFPGGYGGLEWNFVPDNAPICRKPITSGIFCVAMGITELSESTEEINSLHLEKEERKRSQIGSTHDSWRTDAVYLIKLHEVENDWKKNPMIGITVSRYQISKGCFLVSFLVDARGGSMRASRHPGLRIMVPPSAASAPTRVTCRMLRPERTAAPPQLNDGEGLACRIIELGPHPCQFNSPVLLEIPHFAAMRGRQREIVILRSDDAETWKEHSLEATDQAVRSALGSVFASGYLDTLETAEQLKEKRILRVLMTDFPQYLAVVSRLRQEIALIGSDGGVLSSTVVPQVQAVFPEGALQKRIRVGLQFMSDRICTVFYSRSVEFAAHQVPPEMVTRLVGNQVTVSPIVTIEPRRRKFHKPITLTIPLPRSAINSTTSTGKRHHHGGADSAPNSSLRLLCSITGGTAPAVWEDITGSTPLSRVKDCVSFTTTVSARLWLIDCPVISASVEVAMRLYKEASAVPYMGKFIVFAKRPEVDEALMRCFCITDDKVDKTLECQEGFDLVAASNEIEVVDNRPTWLEATGNLVPVCKVDDQLRLHFNAFRENRLAFPVRIKDPQLEPSGKLAFVRDPRPGSVAEMKPMLQEVGGTAITDALPARPICGLDVVLPTEIDGTRSGSVLISGVDGAHTIASTAATSVVSLSCSQPQHFEHPTQKLPEIDSHGRSLVVPPPEWAAVLPSFVSHYVAVRTTDYVISLLPPGLNGSPEPRRLGFSPVPLAMTEESIARTHLDLVEIATQVGSDWPRLVKTLFAPDSTELPPSADQLIDWISRRCASAETLSAAGLTNEGLRSDRDRALAILLAWTIEAGDAATGNELDYVLREIGREDIVKNCMRDIRPVLEVDERERASDQINNAGRGWTPEAQTFSLIETSPPPEQTQDMAVTSLSSEIFTDQLESGQLESSGDLVGERAHQAMEFSLPITEEEEGEGATGAQATSTLEPSSPENAEPVEQPEEAPVEAALPTRAEPEISELTETQTAIPEPNNQLQAQMASLEAATTAGIDLTSQDDLEETGDSTSPHSEIPVSEDNSHSHHQPHSHLHPGPESGMSIIFKLGQERIKTGVTDYERISELMEIRCKIKTQLAQQLMFPSAKSDVTVSMPIGSRLAGRITNTG
ncbi:hypothetical protein ACTXT7_008019 [Hymenolepis weldensis]